MHKKICFRDGGLTVLQVSDPQDLSFINHTMDRMLNRAYDRIKPDLVVFTGDNILGNHLRDARFGSRKTVRTVQGEKRRMEKAIDKLIQPLAERDIPFTLVYGNHDDRNAVSKDEQADIYRRYPNCRGLDNPDPAVDCDTFLLPLYDACGERVLFNLWLLDSAWYDKEKNECFELVKPETVAWFRKTAARVRTENGGRSVPGILFQHIPLPETLRLLEPCPPGVPGCVAADRDKTAFFRLHPARARGILGEFPGVCQQNTGLFDALLADGSVLAVVTGHNHYNCFEGELDGIRLIQSSCASFRCYGGRQRGVRVFTLRENDPAAFQTRFLTYADIVGTGLLPSLCYLLDADGLQKQKYAFLGTCAALLAGGIALCAAKVKERSHK